MPDFDVVVVGGGIVGTAFALGLHSAHARVALIEEGPPVTVDSSWDSRIYTISPGNADWLAALGVWDAIPAERVCRVESMLIYGDERPGYLEFGAYDAGLRELAYVLESRQLQHALRGELERAAHVTLKQGRRCVDVSWQCDQARIGLDDGTAVTGRLVVAADGADSWIRSRAGIRVSANDYHQLGVVANFTAERSHDDIAFQWFRRDGVLALLPLPGRCVSMVWSAPQERARELLAMTPQNLCEEVAQASEFRLGALTLLTGPLAFPLKRQRAQRLVEPRVALIGDAAHNVHPLAGQGVNLGLRDARELAIVLARRGANDDCGNYNLLRRYERARKEDILSLELTTDGLEKLFRGERVWVTRLRNVGLAFVNSQPILKNALIRRAIA
jgi:2-octaprenylphenol hydroxylase